MPNYKENTMPNYRVQKHSKLYPDKDISSSARCGLMDRIDDESKHVLELDLPFSVWGPCLGFALGEVMAFCASKEQAERITKALLLLEQVEKVL